MEFEDDEEGEVSSGSLIMGSCDAIIYMIVGLSEIPVDVSLSSSPVSESISASEGSLSGIDSLSSSEELGYDIVVVRELRNRLLFKFLQYEGDSSLLTRNH